MAENVSVTREPTPCTRAFFHLCTAGFSVSKLQQCRLPNLKLYLAKDPVTFAGNFCHFVATQGIENTRLFLPQFPLGLFLAHSQPTNREPKKGHVLNEISDLLRSLRSKRSRTERTKFGPREGVFALGPREKWGESKTAEGRGWRRGLRVTRISFARSGTLATQATRSDEGLTLETSVFESLYGGQFTLSTQLIKPNYPVILPTDAAPQFL